MEIEVCGHHADDGVDGAEGSSATDAGRAVDDDGSAGVDLTDELNEAQESSRGGRKSVVWPFSVLEVSDDPRLCVWFVNVGDGEFADDGLDGVVSVQWLYSYFVVRGHL